MKDKKNFERKAFAHPEKFGIRFSFQVVRMSWDIAYMTVGFLLGGPVGIVTVGVAFFLGPVIGVMKQKIEKILEGKENEKI